MTGGTGGMVVDAITLEVIRSGLLSVGDEISNLMLGAGGLDLSSGICDSSGRLVAAGQSFVHPVQLGALPVALSKTFERIPPDDFDEGDVVISNDVFTAGGSHLPDVLLLMPIFVGGRRVAFLGARTHWLDIGGNTPGSVEMINAHEIYGDGIRIPPIRIIKAGVLNEDILDLITLNARNTPMRRLDFFRQLGSCELGVGRIRSICARYGQDAFVEALDLSLDYTERRLRAFVAGLPNGTYRADDWVEIDGISSRPLRLSASLTVDGDSLVADLSGTDPQLPFVGFNAPLGPTNAMVLYAIKCVAGGDIPLNSAFDRVVRVVAPAGTAVNALPPTACGGVTGGTELVSRLTEVVIAALAQAAPDRVAASCGSHVLLSVHGIDPEKARRELFGRDEGVAQLMLAFEVHRSGYGARPLQDGATSISAYIGNDPWLSCEEVEFRSPLRVDCFEICADSAGHGRTRGGFGARRRYEVLADDISATFLIGHASTPPYGLFGGTAGRPAQVSVAAGNGEPRSVGWAESMRLGRGMQITVETAGGGGYGPPWQRPAVSVYQDLRQGLISPATAREVYGMVISDDGAVDEAASAALRSELSARAAHGIDRGESGAFAVVDPSLRHKWHAAADCLATTGGAAAPPRSPAGRAARGFEEPAGHQDEFGPRQPCDTAADRSEQPCPRRTTRSR
jgi:N-methylhydantoinase B